MGHAFDIETVAAQAAQRAREPYRDSRAKVPQWMLIGGTMTYDQWRDIRFRPDKALWSESKLPFQVQFFHPGLYYDRTVAVHVVDGEGAKAVPFTPDVFHYGKNTFADRIPRDIGYAGFRIHYPLKNPAYHDEVIVFLGASYFRAVGRDQVWGLSARGLAVDTVEPTGEEFPNFTDFWLVKPERDAKSMVLYALLDSPSVTGAYAFRITPGEQTVVEVDTRVFLRRKVRKLGIAALTSMFLHGENTERDFDDFRPEVHDSDGLLMRFDGGEWLWRPLDNPLRIDENSFRTRNPRGFGLIQRDRDFASHQDLETRAELRPSVWVAPRGDWGDGSVTLIAIPTNTELNDNIVAFWVPATLPPLGEALALSYTLNWYGDDPTRPPGGRVVATRQDSGIQYSGTADNAPIKRGHRFVIDFAGDALSAIPDDRPPRAVVSATAGAEVRDQHVVKNPAARGWRLAFHVKPRDNEPVELRAFLEREGNVLTETWSYALFPEEDDTNGR